jgi:hypothetical protein
MDNVVVDDRHYDSVTIEWTTDVTEQEVQDYSQQWITSRNFLTRRMIGLRRVGESSLTIEPHDDIVADEKTWA